MAEKKSPKKKKLQHSVMVKKLAAATSLLAFAVITAAGLMADASMVSISYRACAAILVVGVVSRVVIKILASYEEMNSGKA